MLKKRLTGDHKWIFGQGSKLKDSTTRGLFIQRTESKGLGRLLKRENLFIKESDGLDLWLLFVLWF